MESVLLFTLCYILFCICFVFPPPEFVSFGLTVESLFSFWLKTEADCFIHHHIRRTVATLITHTCIPLGNFAYSFVYFVAYFIPLGTLIGISWRGRLIISHSVLNILNLGDHILIVLGYVLGIKYISPESSIWDGNLFLDFLVIISFTIPVIAASIAFQWYYPNWRNHPIAENLKQFTSGDNDINRIARDIDNEYRSFNKIIIKCNALTRVVATDNWIIRIGPYSLNIIHQSDASLVVISSDSHLYVPDRPEGSQYLNIDVKSSRANVGSFQIRINSADLKDLQEKMIRPISIMENVDFHGNLTDCFLNVFKKHIKQNPKVLAPENLEVCIGCLQATPNVKLMTSCGDTTGPGKCSMCYCKPMWCEDCMGKWFASRQDQDKPDNWLSSKAACPMCRSTFCLLDVCPLVSTREELEQGEIDS